MQKSKQTQSNKIDKENTITDNLICTIVDVSLTVTAAVLQLGSHDSAIYLFWSHIYLGGMAQNCELNHSARGCQCTGLSL